MFNPYSSGTPDVWYSGTADDLWVDYKYLTKVPKSAPIIVQKMLSQLQRLWLGRRYNEGRNVIVILGTPNGSWVYDKLSWDWPNGITPSELAAFGRTRKEVAEYISKRTMLSCDSSGSSQEQHT